MKKKLTLSIEETVIKSARQYSRKKNKSVSYFVEQYLKHLPAKSRKNLWSDRSYGILKGRLTENQIEADDRLRYLFSKIDK